MLIDLLTDSGTSAMSSEQWAALMRGDESYAGARSWERFEAELKDLTGMPHILSTHQGRAAERLLHGHLGGKGKVFMSSTHFDTTRANIWFSGAEAVDLPVAVGRDPQALDPFKGDHDVEALERTIARKGAANVATVVLAVTNNSGGGQPVSMGNAKAVQAVCRRHGILFVLDACRIAENAWFIRDREPGYADRSIAQEMFGLADAATMSAKKDALVNMGGFLTLRNDRLADEITYLLIITEGYTTYGGLSGRDMEAVAQGLKEVFDPDYLDHRITSTRYLGEHLMALGAPIMRPVGGHAVYVDARGLYPHIAVEQYPGQAGVCAVPHRRHPVRGGGSVSSASTMPLARSSPPPWTWCAWRSRGACTRRATSTTWCRASHGWWPSATAPRASASPRSRASWGTSPRTSSRCRPGCLGPR